MAVSDTHDLAAEPLPGIERPQRADAARNRERLLDAAAECFREHGLDVAVTEIAAQAGVGRATLFRNFPTKGDLVIAIIVQRIEEAVSTGRELLARGEPRGGLLAGLIGPLVDGQRLDRALFEGVAEEEWLQNPQVQNAHREMIDVLDALIAADHAAGSVRGDIGAFDVLWLIKGVCHMSVDLGGDAGERAVARQMTLIRSAISVEAQAAHPLPDHPMSFEDFNRAHCCGATTSGPSPAS